MTIIERPVLLDNATFNAEMAASLIEQLYQERDLDREYFQRALNEKDECIEEAEREKSKLLSRITKMEDRLYLYDVQHSYDRRIFANPNIDSSTKLVSSAMVRHITKEHNDAHTPMVLIMEDIAEQVGVSSSTVGRVNKKMSSINAWDYNRSKPELLDNGKYKTTITIALQDIIDHPEILAFEKHQGGARLRIDKGTGEALDTISADYSRSQDQVTIRLLPGQRADLDPRNFINAIKNDQCFLDDHATMRIRNLDEQAQKQVAFPAESVLHNDFSTSNDQLSATQDDKFSDEEEFSDARPGTLDEKQDAFRAEIKSRQPSGRSKHTQKAIRTIEPPVETCTAIYQNEQCGSTKWRWHSKETVYICEKCWTPARNQPTI